MLIVIMVIIVLIIITIMKFSSLVMIDLEKQINITQRLKPSKSSIERKKIFNMHLASCFLELLITERSVHLTILALYPPDRIHTTNPPTAENKMGLAD